MKNTNYLLIEMNRYDVCDSTVVVVTEDFIDRWLAFRGKMKFTTAPVAVLDHEVTGWDEEEVTWLWMPTDREVDESSQEYMKEVEEDMVEEN
jgi:hypothetical protein